MMLLFICLYMVSLKRIQIIQIIQTIQIEWRARIKKVIAN